jgi:PleD family two-component response regulator
MLWGSILNLILYAKSIEVIAKSDDTYRVFGLAPGQQPYRILVVDEADLNRNALTRLLEQVELIAEVAGSELSN